MLDALTAGGSQASLAAAVRRRARKAPCYGRLGYGCGLAWTSVAGAEEVLHIARGRRWSVYAAGRGFGAELRRRGLKTFDVYRWRVTAVVGSNERPIASEVAATTRRKAIPCDNPGSCPIVQTAN